MYLGKEVRILLKDQAKDSYLELKKRSDKESQSILNSIERIKAILKDNNVLLDPFRGEVIQEILEGFIIYQIKTQKAK